MRLAIVSLLALACAACGPRGSTADLQVSEVPCGADCELALTTYLREHGAYRIAGVVPVSHPRSAADPHVGHTDSLLVLHTFKSGPWPRAAELTVVQDMCALTDDPELPGCNRNPRMPIRFRIATRTDFVENHPAWQRDLLVVEAGPQGSSPDSP